LLIAVLLLLASTPAFAKTPLTHEALWLMKRVGSPAVSPDGKWIAFPVTEPTYDERETVSDLWITPADGSAAPRRITFSKAAESGVTWSPDSKRIAFSARREGDEISQIYILDVSAGDEAMRLSQISSGASAPLWSPDGKWILFQTTMYPAAADDAAHRKLEAEARARKYRARVYEGFPLRYWDHWLDERRVSLYVQAADPKAPARCILPAAFRSSPGFGGVSGVASDDLQPAWAPDSGSIVFAATNNRHEAAYAPTLVHLYSIDPLTPGSEPQPLTSGSESLTKPQFSPDGRTLYALHNHEGPKVYSLNRLVSFTWPGASQKTFLFPDWDHSIDEFAAAPGEAIYLLSEGSGDTSIHLSRDRRTPRLHAAGAGTYSDLRLAGSELAARWESSIHPAEIVRVTPDGRKLLSSFNVTAAAEIDWQAIRHFTFTSKGGRKIHNMAVLPPNFDPARKYPLVTLIHGGANMMWKDQFFLRWNYHLLAAPGYVLLLTNYTGSTGFGERFAQAIQGDPLKTPGEEINQAVEEAIRIMPFIDGSRVAAAGASYGGHLVNWLAAVSPERYKCFVSHAGLINLESQWGTSDTIYSRELTNGGPVWDQGPVWREQNPIRLARNFKTPILLTIGENDFRVPLNQTLEHWSALQRLKVPSKLIVFPEANHWIQRGEDSRYFYQEVQAWLKRWL
jgi:dipeptidyl aminopeptidase/acylaminoacyl peptidase